jgi:hypothetical protein
MAYVPSLSSSLFDIIDFFFIRLLLSSETNLFIVQRTLKEASIASINSRKNKPANPATVVVQEQRCLRRFLTRRKLIERNYSS